MFEEKIAKRILEWKKRKAGPFEVQLNPTNKCNLKCKFCWLRDFDDGSLTYEELTTRKYEEIIKDCYRMDVHTIEITGGGEPLMREDIFQIMKKIKKYGMFGRLVTNGTLFTEEKIRELIKIGWDEIVFSLDSSRKEINDFLRGESFEKIVENIKKFQIEKMKRKREKPLISIHTVLCNKNYKYLPEMFEFAYKLGVKNLLVEPIVLLATKTKAGKELLFRKKDLKKLKESIKKAIEIAYKYNFQTNIDKLEFELIKKTSKMKEIIQKEGGKGKFSSLPCYQPFYHITIRPWGSVGPCCMFDKSEENVKSKSLKEIWFGEYFEKRRKEMLEGKLPKYCEKCCTTLVQYNQIIREQLSQILNTKTTVEM